MSCLLSSLCSYCKNENSGNAILWLKTPLWLLRTFRIEPNPLPLDTKLSQLRPLTSHHTWLRSSLQSSRTLKLTHCSHASPGCASLFPSWSILLPPFCLADSLSTFRKLKHHFSQKAFSEFPRWLQGASHGSAPKAVLLRRSDQPLCLALWLKLKALGVSCVFLMIAHSVF